MIYIQKMLNSLKNTYYKVLTHNSIQIRLKNDSQLNKILENNFLSLFFC